MVNELVGKKVSIWGAGLGGRKVYSYLKSKVDIVCFYDNDEKKHGTLLDGIPVKKWSEEEPETFIVIASAYWKEIIPKLAKKGLKIFKDFSLSLFLQSFEPVKYELMCEIQKCMGEWQEEDWIRYKGDKQLVCVYAGCHGRLLEVLLSMHPRFREKYKVISTPKERAIEGSLYSKGTINLVSRFASDTCFFRQVDLFVYRPADIKKTWNLRYDVLMEKLSANCKKVKLSPLTFSGYFPQCRAHEKEFASVNLLYSFRYSDKYINKLWKQGYSEDEIVNMVKSDDFLSAEEVEEFLRVSLTMLNSQEADVDVKIYDYIEAHCREEQLFYDPSHATNKVFVEYANRIIQYLFPDNNLLLEDLYSDADITYLRHAMLNENTPVYPCVVKALGLSSYEKVFRVNSNSKIIKTLTFDEYIREYIRVNLK